MGNGNGKPQIDAAEYREAYRTLKAGIDKNNELLKNVAVSASNHDVHLRNIDQRLSSMQKSLLEVQGKLVQMLSFNSRVQQGQMSNHQKAMEMMEAVQSDVAHLKATDVAPSKHICGVLAHTLRKIEEVKGTEGEIMSSVTQLQTNLDILSNRQIKSDLEMQKRETSISAKLKELEGKIVGLQLLKLSGKVVEDSSEDDSLSELPEETQGKDSKNKDNKSRFRRASAEEAKANCSTGTSAKQQDKKRSKKPHPHPAPVPEPSSKQTDSSRGEIVLKDLDLLIYGFNGLMGTTRYFFTNKEFSPKFGGYFKGHVRFCLDNTLVFSLLFDPGNAAQAASVVEEDAQFNYSLRIQNPEKGGKSWFLAAGKRSYEELRKSKWGKANGYELSTKSFEEVKKYLSTDGKDQLAVKFIVSPC